MKKVLLQLDTDAQPSTFDAMVAIDAAVDALLRHGGVDPDAAHDLVQAAFFARAPKDLASLAVWVGGSQVTAGEEVFEAVQRAFFGPFRVSVMLDSNGCNTTTATAIALISRRFELRGRRAVVVGAGAVGLRSARLLGDLGSDVVVSAIPSSRFAGTHRRARGLTAADQAGFSIAEPACDQELADLLDGASIVLAAGPAGVEVLPQKVWSSLASVELLGDYNAAEPLGIAGTTALDDFADYDGRLVLGASRVGRVKMNVHKACLVRLFETNDRVFDLEGVYELARELT